MKKLLSITLIVFLAGGFLLTEGKKAEAMNNESAALLTAGLVLIGAPIVYAITHDHHAAPVYSRPHRNYREKTIIVYKEPRYERHHWKKHARYDRKHRHDRYDRDWDERRSHRRNDHRY